MSDIYIKTFMSDIHIKTFMSDIYIKTFMSDIYIKTFMSDCSHLLKVVLYCFWLQILETPEVLG